MNMSPQTNDLINSTGQFQSNLDKIPLHALRQKSLRTLSRLNRKKLIPSEETGLPRDWRGISDLIGIEHRSDFEMCEDPMKKIFDLWKLDSEYSDISFISNLLDCLQKIDRTDVFDDIQQSLVSDVRIYLEKQSNPVYVQETSIIPVDGNEMKILTRHDEINRKKGLPVQKYDALVIYADDDIEFVHKLIKEMEQKNITLCIKERDMLGGVTFEHEADMRLVSERCNRIIVVTSPSFYLSAANNFIVNYAQAIGIDQGKRKIIPCMYKPCKLQPPLDIYFALNYSRSGVIWNFWDKLYDSVAQIGDSSPSIFSDEIENPFNIISGNDEKVKTPTAPIKIPRKKNSKILSKSQPTPELEINNFKSLDELLTKNSISEEKISLSDSMASSMGSYNCNGEIKKDIWYKKLFSTKTKKGDKNDNVIEKPKRKNWLRRKLVSA